MATIEWGHLKQARREGWTSEETIMVAYLLGWSGDQKAMRDALNKRYKRLKARQRGEYIRGERRFPTAA